jgi:thiamine pyrophosphokinase
MLACSLAIEQGVHEILILGGTGGRIDHSLSNLFLLENLRGRGVRAVLCDGANRVQLLRDESAELVRSSYRYFSLFALEDASVTITGCKYPLTDAPLVRTLPYAVSNEITADTAKISVSGGPVFLIESGNAPTA